uniref:Uncharacterized protein n=1 Tax=Anguilla anguilla TaxID=7936 RepID=A0A0E9R2E1_ANGAN
MQAACWSSGCGYCYYCRECGHRWTSVVRETVDLPLYRLLKLFQLLSVH